MESDVFSSTILVKLQTSLMRWYDESRRDLPWRRTRDPYRIWVSEMMLQQTRVAAVLEFYRRFLERFPDAHSLASAKEADVVAAWSGLGYYRRARAMHATAKTVVNELSGRFPRTPAELEQLPGIGRYTAAAIGSIAFGYPVAVVDGNVERVLSRVIGKELRDREESWIHGELLLDKNRPGDWNQAMMELGATVCHPSDPKCLVCPIRNWCKEPGREVKKLQASRKQKQLLYGLAQRRGSVYLVQRSKKSSLMAGMWELPSLEKENGFSVLHRARHSITNTDYKVSVLALEAVSAEGGKWVRCDRLHQLPVTGLTRKILRAANLWPTDGI
jgi:A/G-specific adenine glycosylase